MGEAPSKPQPVVVKVRKTVRKDAQGFPVVDPPKEKADSDDGERKDQAPLRRFG